MWIAGILMAALKNLVSVHIIHKDIGVVFLRTPVYGEEIPSYSSNNVQSH